MEVDCLLLREVLEFLRSRGELWRELSSDKKIERRWMLAILEFLMLIFDAREAFGKGKGAINFVLEATCVGLAPNCNKTSSMLVFCDRTAKFMGASPSGFVL